jgi:hypothetical protein
VKVFTTHAQHMTIDEDDLSGENLYNSLVNCVKVVSEDTADDDLTRGNDKDIDSDNADRRKVQRLESSDKRSALTPEILSRKWGIGLETAQTIKVKVTRG